MLRTSARFLGGCALAVGLVIVALLAVFVTRQGALEESSATIENVSTSNAHVGYETASLDLLSGDESEESAEVPFPREAEAAPASNASHVIREEKRVMKPALLELAREFNQQPFAQMDFPLFDGEFVHLTALRHTQIDDQSGVFTGRVEGDPLSHVVLSYVGGAESGSIHHPANGTYFEVRNADNGNSSYLTRVDPSEFPPCAACMAGAIPPGS